MITSWYNIRLLNDNQKFFLLVISTEHHRERSTESREMASPTYSTLSEEQRETDKGSGLFDTTMQPVVKLYRIGMYCFIYFTTCSKVVQDRFVVFYRIQEFKAKTRLPRVKCRQPWNGRHQVFINTTSIYFLKLTLEKLGLNQTLLLNVT